MTDEVVPASASSDSQQGSGQGPSPAQSPVRKRILRHMRQVLGNAAIAGGVLQLSCSTPCVCDPLPPPADCNSPNEPNCPVVCDPLPPPYVRSVDPKGRLLADRQAQWIEAGDRLVLRVTLSLLPAKSTFSGTPVLDGAVLRASDVREGVLTFTCSPLEAATVIKASVPVQYGQASAALHLELNVIAPPAPGKQVPVILRD